MTLSVGLCFLQEVSNSRMTSGMAVWKTILGPFAGGLVPFQPGHVSNATPEN